MSNKSNSKTAAERNEEYLLRLEHKNRLKKNLTRKKLSEQIAEDREKGFSTQFSGANASAAEKNFRTKPTAVINTPTLSYNAFKMLDQEPQRHADRKKGWAPKTRHVPSVSPVTVSPVTATTNVMSKEKEGASFQSNGEAVGRRPLQYGDEEDEEEDYGDDFECEDLEEAGDSLDEESTNESDGMMFDFPRQYRHAPGGVTTVVSSTNHDFGDGDFSFQDSMDLSLHCGDSNNSSRKCNTSSSSIPSHDRIHKVEGNVQVPDHKPSDEGESSQSFKKKYVPTAEREKDDEDMSVLASRLKALDPTKQGQLLALIKQMEGGSADILTDNRSVSTDNNQIYTQNQLRPLSRLEEDQHRCNIQQVRDKSIVDEHSKSLHHIAATPRETNEDDISHTNKLHRSSDSSNKVKIRIKAYNSWEKTKYASLAAVRLCVRGSNVEIPLSEFSVQVSIGNIVQPKTAEVARNVSHLFAKSRVMKKQDWRFPIAQNSCVQLEMNGTLGETLIEDLELVVWNGSGDSKMSSPVKDMDIYVDSKCIWTGSLEKSENTSGGSAVQSSKSIPNFENVRLLLDHRGACSSPSVTAALLPSNNEQVSQLYDTKEATISTQVPTKRSHVMLKGDKVPRSCDSDNVPALSFTGMSTASSVGAFMATTTEFPNDNKEPAWFSDLKTPRLEVEQITPFDEAKTLGGSDGVHGGLGESSLQKRNISEKVKSSRRATKDVVEVNVEHFVNKNDTTATPIKSRRNLGETNEGNYTEIEACTRREVENGNGAMLHTAGSVGAVKTGTGIGASMLPRRGGRRRVHTKEDERKEEASLRQSLEALKKSDLGNRGRIESELRSSVNTEVGLITSDLRHLDVTDSVLSNEIEKQNVLKQRSVRIGAVQEKVSNALQDLATTMSTISKINNFGRRDGDALDNKCIDSSYSEEKLKQQQQYTSTLAPCLDDSYLESSVYNIPVVPCGTVLTFEILSNWGDPYYVGLCGLDLFDKEGKVLTPGNGVDSITAVPGDINDLPEYDNDPRTVANLLDETNFTRDDMHVWLAPHGATMTPPLSLVASITIVFTCATSLSLARIWNYNKSRTHCYRGVRRARMKLDNNVIFEGEIRRAPGLITSPDDCSEVVLFTTSGPVLEKISLYDAEMGYRIHSDNSATAWVEVLKERHTNFRPSTSDKKEDAGTGASACTSLQRKKAASITSQSVLAPHFENTMQSHHSRPFTAVREQSTPVLDTVQTDLPHKETLKETTEWIDRAAQDVFPPTSLPVVSSDMSTGMSTSGLFSPTQRENQETKLLLNCGLHTPSSDTHSAVTARSSSSVSEQQLQEYDLISCRVLSFALESTWGDKSYIGLGGVEVTLGCSSIVAELGPESIDAEPRDLSAIGVFDDPRKVENLVNGINDTTDDQHMWLIPFTAGSKHELRIDMGSVCNLSGINVWNYNKSNEDALRGVRVVTIFGDGKLIGKQEFRIAPGCDGIVFKQHICFRDVKQNSRHTSKRLIRYITPALRQDYEPPFNLSGMLWKINIYSNWGDGYYVGLDGLEFVGHDGHVIDIVNLATIVSSPHMWDIEIGANDPRVPENLKFDKSRRTSWLTPLSQSITRAEQLTSVQRLKRHQAHPLQTSSRSCPSADMEHEAYFYDHNVLFVLFNQPINVAAIRFFNYGKSPNRGVKQFGIEVDHKVVYMGRLQRHDESFLTSRGGEGGQSVVFSNDPALTKREKNMISYCGATGDQDVLCINDRKVTVRSKDMYELPSVSSEGIYSDLAKRPVTAAFPHQL